MNGTPRESGRSESRRGGSGMRLRALVRKEFLQILRDPSSIAIAFLMPVVLLFLFGYGVSLDAEHVPVGIVVEKPDQDTSRFISSFRESRYFEPVFLPTMPAAVESLAAGDIDAIVHLRHNFSKKKRSSGDAPVQVIINGVDANTARILSGYIEGAWIRWLGQEAAAEGTELTIPVQIEQRVWFNSELRSRNYLVPGLIAIIMILIGALLTAMVMAREWERGTMEALMVTPVSRREIILGKLIPYYVLGIGGMVLSVLLAIFLFDVPLRGSVLVLFAASSLFLLTALGMGLLISILAKNQFVAGQAAIIVTFLPAFILSGFIFDINSMPAPIQAITHLIAARYYVAMLQTIFLAGNIWSVIAGNALALVIMATVFLGLSRRKFRKRLE